MKCTIFQRIRKRAISLLGLAMFSILLGASTAQAACTVVPNGSSFRAVCPLTSDKGYVYDWINNQWYYASYYVGMTTNFPELYLYGYQLWVGKNRSTGVWFAYTRTGWYSLSLQNEALRLLWQLGNTAASPPMSQAFVNTVNTNASTNLAIISAMR